MRRFASLAVALVLAGALAGCVGDGEPQRRALLDATRTWVDVSDLERIVPTSHDLVEILFELGHGERVAAVPSWIDHPANVSDLPRLGRPHVLNVEEILAVGPTLVLLKDHPLQPSGLAAGLRRAGVPVFVFDNHEAIENIRYTYEQVGWILEDVDPDVREKVADRWRAIATEIDEIRATVAASTAPKPVAVYQLPAGFVAGKGTSADLLLTIAGARNLAAEAGLTGYQQISHEVFLERDPERVVASRTAGAAPATFYAKAPYDRTTAARLGPETLLVVDPATTALVGPRFVEGLRLVAEWLHPVAFERVEAHVTWTQEGATLHAFAAANADARPITYRFDPGDGSPARTSDEGDFSHTYAAGAHTARLLVLDGAGRIAEHRRTVEVR